MPIPVPSFAGAGAKPFPLRGLFAPRAPAAKGGCRASPRTGNHGGLIVVAPARAAEVVSSNVVGYQKLKLQPGYNMIPNNFVTIGDEEMYGINEMFEGVENATATRSMDTADRIDTWDPAVQGYVSYYRMTNRNGDKTWWGRDDSPNTATEDTFPNYGEGAFYYNQADDELDLTISGQVKSTATTITFASGYSILANPYPTDIPINGDVIDWSNATATRSMDTADRIDLWDANAQGYVSYYRMTNRNGDKTWWGRDDSPNTATEDSIPANQSFFYYSQASEAWTATIQSPVAAD